MLLLAVALAVFVGGTPTGDAARAKVKRAAVAKRVVGKRAAAAGKAAPKTRAKRPATAAKIRKRARRAAPRTAAKKQRVQRSAQAKRKAKVLDAVKKADVLVFDIDNTVMDTRPRTVLAVREFAKTYEGNLTDAQRKNLSKITVEQAGRDGEETARKFRLDGEATEALQDHWVDTWWNPKNAALDKPMRQAREIFRAAKGKEIIYLSGRQDDWMRATVAQLKKAGFPNADSKHILLKSGAFGRTPQWKVKELRALARSGKKVIFFEDSRTNIRAVQKAKLPVKNVELEFPVVEPGAGRRGAGVLTMPYEATN